MKTEDSRSDVDTRGQAGGCLPETCLRGLIDRGLGESAATAAHLKLWFHSTSTVGEIRIVETVGEVA